jgi:NTE family protein
VPVIFKPVRLRGRYLVDGGLLNPVPVDVLKKNGSDFTIAVNVIAPRPQRPRRRKKAGSRERLLLARLDDFLSRKLISGRPNEEPNMIEAFLSTMEIMQQKLIAARLRIDVPDAVIHIETSDIKMFEFYRPAEIIRRGEEAARREIETVLAGWRRRQRAGNKGG